jgi:hypothetical protein
VTFATPMNNVAIFTLHAVRERLEVPVV